MAELIKVKKPKSRKAHREAPKKPPDKVGESLTPQPLLLETVEMPSSSSLNSNLFSSNEEISPETSSNLNDSSFSSPFHNLTLESDASLANVTHEPSSEEDTLISRSSNTSQSLAASGERNFHEQCEEGIESTIPNELTYVYSERSPYAPILREVQDCIDELPSAPPPPLENYMQDILSQKEKKKSMVKSVPEQKSPLEECITLEAILDGVGVEGEVLHIKHYNLPEVENEEIVALSQLQKKWHAGHKPSKSPLFLLLAKYMDARKVARRLEEELRGINKELQELQTGLWTYWPKIEMKEKAKCRDNNTVTITHSYSQARLNKDVLVKLQTTLAAAKNTQKQIWSNTAMVRLLNSKIDYFLYGIQSRLVTDSGSLRSMEESYKEKCLDDLSAGLDVLFYFVRTASLNCVEDNEIVVELRNWACALAALVFRVDAWQLQLHYVWHVLRGPSNADWAASYIACSPKQPDHVCAILSLILQRIDNRRVYFDDSQGSPWVVIENDEDEDISTVNESVLNSILTRLPIEEIIRNHMSTPLSEATYIDFLAYLSSFVRILESGLETYGSSEPHRLFSKKIAKIIRVLIEVSCKKYEQFPYVTKGVQMAYDVFVQQCSEVFIRYPSVWQFLAGAPFTHLSNPNRWRLYQLMTVLEKGSKTYPSDLSRKISQHLPPDQSHLMAAVAGLAENGPALLCRTVLVQLFYAGFISPTSSVFAYKDAKELISSLVGDKLELLSELLLVYRTYLDSGELDPSSQIELWEALPASEWTPRPEDIGLLTQWVTHGAAYRDLAKCILKRLDYSKMELELQKRIGRSVIRAAENSSFVGMWSMLCQLRLHLIDRDGDCDLSHVPDLAADAELGLLVSQGSLGSIYLALQTTTLGHAVPLMFSEGFKLVRQLFSRRCYEAAFACIDSMAGMFWNCPDSLTECKDFMTLMGEILVADDSYLRITKQVQVGPVVSKFLAMLHSNLERCSVDILDRAVKMWLNVLTSLPLWQSCSGALHALDVVCRRAFVYPSAWVQVIQIFEAATQSLPVAPNGPFSPITNILRLGSTINLPTLLPNNCDGNVSWFAYAAITVEFNVHEKNTSVWNELLRELWNGKGKKTSIDGSLKKVCSNLKIPARPSAQLAFYKWTAQALAMPKEHPLNILVWKNIFALYLARLPGLVDRGSVGKCFFDCNGELKKQLVTRLNELAYAQPQLSTVFETMRLWLEDEKLLAPQLHVPSLPAKFNTPILEAVLSGQETPWFTLLPLKHMCDNNTKDSAEWATLLGRTVRTRRALSAALPLSTCEDTFLKDLGGKMASMPPIVVLPPILSKLPDSRALPVHQVLSQSLERLLSQLSKEAKKIAKYESSLLRQAGQLFTCAAKEITLYQSCQGSSTKQGKMPCCGTASLVLKYEEWTACPTSQEEFIQNLQSISLPFENLHIDKELWTSLCCLSYLQDSSNFENLACSLRDLFLLHLKLWERADSTNPTIADGLKEIILCLGSTGASISQRFLFNAAISSPQALFLHQLLHPETSRKWVELYALALESNPALLQYFNPKKWLSSLPESEQRKKVLSLILDSLREHRPNVDKVLNMHLTDLIKFNVNESLGSALLYLTTAPGFYSTDTWLAVMSTLSNFSKQPIKDLLFSENFQQTSADHLLALIREFSAKTVLDRDFLHTIIAFLGSTWEKQRKSNPVPLYNLYGNAVTTVLTLTGVLVSTSVFLSSSADECWSSIDTLMSAWLIPYDKMPFLPEHATTAVLAVTFYVNAISDAGDKSGNMVLALSRLLLWYGKNFAEMKVGGFILAVVHSSLLKLPWHKAKPSLRDVEMICAITKSSELLSSSFIGYVFSAIDWDVVVKESLCSYGSDVNRQLHAHLLDILVRLSFEPSMRSDKTFNDVLEKSCEWAWHLLDAGAYSSTMHFYPTLCDTLAVFEDVRAKRNDRDGKVLRLLQKAGAYTVGLKYQDQNSPAKRQSYLQAVIKCVAIAMSKSNRAVSAATVTNLMANLLTDLETIISSNVPKDYQLPESIQLLGEILRLLLEQNLAADVEEGIIRWLLAGKGLVLTPAFLQCIGRTLDNPIMYATLCEAAVEAYFLLPGGNQWHGLVGLMTPYNIMIDQVLVSNGCLLTLHVIYLQRLTNPLSSAERRSILTALLQTLSTVKPTLVLEPKLLLLSLMCLVLIQQESDIAALLKTLSEHAMVLTTDRSSGFLSTIGLKKNPSPSINMKLCCLTLSAGINKLLCIPDSVAISTLERSENDKQFGPVMGQLLTARQQLNTLSSHSQLVHLLCTIAAQLFNKSYFVL